MVPFVWSLPCLISALTQAGGGGLLFRLLVPSRCGEGRRCFPVCAAQAPGCSIWSVPCPARGSSPRVLHKSADSAAPAFCAFPARAAQAARSLMGALSSGVVCLLPSTSPAPVPAGQVCAPCVSLWPSWRMSTIQNLRKTLVKNWRPVCSVLGDAVLRAEPALFPSPLPPAFGRAGPVSRLAPQDLLGPFVLWTAVSVFGRLIFSLPFAVPQFKLVTHKSSLRLPSGHSGPVLTLSNAACSSPFRPYLLVADASVWGTFLLGVAFRNVICGFYLFSPSQLCCPLRFKNLPQTRQVFPGVWKLPLLRLPSQDGSPIPSSFVSLFIFYILSYLLSKTMGCFSGCLMTSASDQKLFCEVCSAFNCSFDEFVGKKVVSPSYSSAILYLFPYVCIFLTTKKKVQICSYK